HGHGERKLYSIAAFQADGLAQPEITELCRSTERRGRGPASSIEVEIALSRAHDANLPVVSEVGDVQANGQVTRRALRRPFTVHGDAKRFHLDGSIICKARNREPQHQSDNQRQKFQSQFHRLASRVLGSPRSTSGTPSSSAAITRRPSQPSSLAA